MANNPGRPIPPNKVWIYNGPRTITRAFHSFIDFHSLSFLVQVLAFNTREEVDKWLFNNPVRCTGALHFNIINGNIINYGIQTNSTEVMKRRVFQDPTFKFQIPLQLAAEREIARTLIGGIYIEM